MTIALNDLRWGEHGPPMRFLVSSTLAWAGRSAQLGLENAGIPRVSHSDWGIKLRQRFGDVRRDDAAWSRVKERLPVGSHATGEVVTRAPFGVWLDIGVGFPALLEVPEIAGASDRPLLIDDYPAEGSIVIARVVGFRDERRQVYLSQRAGRD